MLPAVRLPPAPLRAFGEDLTSRRPRFRLAAIKRCNSVPCPMKRSAVPPNIRRLNPKSKSAAPDQIGLNGEARLRRADTEFVGELGAPWRAWGTWCWSPAAGTAWGEAMIRRRHIGRICGAAILPALALTGLLCFGKVLGLKPSSAAPEYASWLLDDGRPIPWESELRSAAGRRRWRSPDAKRGVSGKSARLPAAGRENSAAGSSGGAAVSF